MDTTNITIREGGFYQARSGYLCHVIREDELPGKKMFMARHKETENDEGYEIWHYEDGRSNLDNPALDLIAEWTDDEPDTPQIDLTAITTPVGLLPPETQAALKAHDGPVEFYWHSGWEDCRGNPTWSVGLTYRAAPHTKVETVTNREMYLTARGCIARYPTLGGGIPITITYTITNGVIDPASYRVEARG